MSDTLDFFLIALEIMLGLGMIWICVDDCLHPPNLDDFHGDDHIA